MSGPGRPAWAFVSALMLGLYWPGSAGAVQVPAAALPVDAPWTLPLSTPLLGLDKWRLQGVFHLGNGAGWVLLSTDQASALRVEPGAMLPDGIQLEAIEQDGVWLRRGQQRAYLRLAGSAQSLAPAEYALSLSPVAVIATPACQLFMAGGVPIDELTAVGVCPELLD